MEHKKIKVLIICHAPHASNIIFNKENLSKYEFSYIDIGMYNIKI